MGSTDNTNNSGVFYIQNFSNPGQINPPLQPYHPHNYGLTTSTSSYTNISSSFTTYQHPYVPYVHENAPRPLQYSYSVPHLNSRYPIACTLSDGARLMALLNSHSSSSLEQTPPALLQGTSMPPPLISPAVPTPPPVPAVKSPRGRLLKGKHVVYDVDLRLPGEVHPQLEVSPITVYSSDPILVLGRQIAVNRSYICYGLRAGTIRILNINTALRELLRGHTQKVTDMTFFAEDVHLLASSSSDGKVFIRKIVEDFGEDGKMQITEQIILAIQFIGDFELVHPRLCWHNYQQDVLVVGIGKYILKLDVMRVRSAAPSSYFSAEDPLKCDIENPIEGVYCMGKHDGEVTDLSIGQWNTTRLISASKDGLVQIWGDKKMLPLATLKPHDGRPVGSVTFLPIPQHPDHKVLLTAGPLNRELKLWVPASSDGCLSPSSSENWQCIQTLELISSSESRNEDAFFNHVLVVPRANLILLANGKKNAIYAVHIEFGSKPATTCMNYLAEFSVEMPILNLTATNENATDGEGIVQIYCIQSQAIQQHALDLSLCSPPRVVPLISEGSSASNALHTSGFSTFAPEEQSHGKNVGEVRTGTSALKSARPINVAENASSSVIVNSVGHSERHDLLAVSAADTKFVDSVTASIPIGNVPLSSEVPVPLSPRLSTRQSGSESASRTFDQGIAPVSSFGDQPNEQIFRGHFIERKPDSVFPTLAGTVSLEAIPTTHKMDGSSRNNDETKGRFDMSASVNTSISIECQVSSSPTHLITPSQLMSMVIPSPESVPISKQASKGNDRLEGTDTSSKMNKKLDTEDIYESGLNNFEEMGLKQKAESRSRYSSSLPTGASINTVSVEEALPGEDGGVLDERDQSAPMDEIKDLSTTVCECASLPATSQSLSVAKGKKSKNKTSSATVASSSTVVTPTPISDAQLRTTASNPSTENIAVHIIAMQDSLNQLVTLQKELQKQMTVLVAAPVAKEGKRIETALGKRMEKVLKTNLDDMWARIQEENVKHEKSEPEHMQQLTTLLSNSANKDLPEALERGLKKESTSLGPSTARIVNLSFEKALATAMNDTLQKGINDKAMAQLEKSVVTKLEPTLSRQIQTQFQASGKQALQDALRSCFEVSVVPAIKLSCRSMFEQIDSAFQKGMAEHTSTAQQQFVLSHTVLASTLQDTVASVSCLAQSLKGELANGIHKLLILAGSSGTSSAHSVTFSTKASNGALVGLSDKAISLKHLEESLDPTKELSRLVSDCKFEQAFHKALQMSDVAIVSWLSHQVDPSSLFSKVPLPLSQGVLLSLVQQLGCDLGKDTTHKLVWIREAALALNPNDPLLAPHMRPILEQLYQNLHRQMLIVNSGGDANSARLVLHLVHSILTACK